MSSYTPLHVHTDYSLLDGAAPIDRLVERASELGMDALAVTDHGALHGAIKFYKACRKKNLNPIIGYEAYIVDDRFARDDSNYHLTILAKNRTGFQNLLRLASTAFLEGFYYKPRIDTGLLCDLHDGLIVLSGCMGGKFAKNIDVPTSAMVSIEPMIKAFGSNFFVEIMRNGQPLQEHITEATIDFANHFGLPMVATCDSHYVLKEDAKAQDILMCVNTGSRLSQPGRFAMDCDRYYLRSSEEMYQDFSSTPDAVARTNEIAAQVDIQLELGVKHFPIFQPPDQKISADYIRDLVYDGLAQRIPGAIPEYRHRADMELKVIHDLGYDDYFLMIHEFVKWARGQGIMSSARGSGVGSLVCYCLYISHVDPIEYSLLFERFLSYSRREAPDIDIDFERDRRDEVMQYVTNKYGADKVAKICTFGTMGAKSSIKDVARVYGYPLDKTSAITECVSDDPFHELSESLDHPGFRAIYDSDPKAREVIDMALKLEGTARNLGTHAAGIVVSDTPLVERVPLAKVGGKGEVNTQWDMDDLQDVGLVKLDCLGLRNLDILSETVRLVEQVHGSRINVHQIPMNDPAVYAMLSRGDTSGLFQLESNGMSDLLVRIQPTCVTDISACIALFRPGPLDSNMVETYVARRKGEEPVAYPHSIVQDVLGPTFGVMVFQEQVMMVVHLIGGIPLDDSYSCIKAISKKLPDKVAAYEERFVNGCRALGVDGGALWEQIKTFARYGFNASHSTAYAFVAYQTTWFKTHYPAEFMAAVLNADINNRNFTTKDKLVEHLIECHRMRLNVLPPNIDTSTPRFSVSNGNILFGLSSIKGVSLDAAVAISRNAPYTDLWDFYSRPEIRSHVARAMARNLIYVGAFDHLPGTRPEKKQALDRAINQSKQRGFRTTGPKGVNYIEQYGDPLELEKEFSGMYITGHPTDKYKHLYQQHCNVHPSSFNTLDHRTQVIGGGLISSLSRGITRHGSEFMTFDLELSGDSIPCVMWQDSVTEYGHLATGQCFVKGYVSHKGLRRNLVVNEIVPFGKQDWSMALRVSNLPHAQVASLISKYPGPCRINVYNGLLDLACDNEVVICDPLVNELKQLGAKVEVYPHA